MLSVDGRRGRRRAALRARGPAAGRPTSTTSACATPSGMPDRRARALPGRVRAVWDGCNEIDGFNALVLGRRADLAPGDGAAGLREVHAAGRHAVRPGLHRGGAAQQRRHHPAAGRSCSRPASTRRGDPAGGRRGARRRGDEIEARIVRALDDVASLDHDRILRSYLTAHQARRCARTSSSATPTAAPTAVHLLQARARGDPRPARAAAALRDLRLLARASRACTCASARSRAAACAGRTAATTSAPRCSAWSRRRWSRTP